MARTSNKDVRPITLLVDYTCKGAIVVEPGCRGTAGESLDTAERCVLSRVVGVRCLLGVCSLDRVHAYLYDN